MYGTNQTPNFFMMMIIGFASAGLISSALLSEKTRQWIWQATIGEKPIRYGLAFLSFLLSFMAGAAYLTSLYPIISSCTTSYSSSFSISSTSSTTTTIQGENNSVEIETPEPIIESSVSTSSTDCIDTNQLSTRIELWLSMMTPPMARCLINICTEFMNTFNSTFPANSQDAYNGLWIFSIASAFVSLYMTSYLLRDSRKRKNEDGE